MHIVLEQPSRARLITSADEDLPVSATLRYSAADPLAIEIVFPPEASLDRTTASWTFARELLESGLSAPAGSGDVHIWPCGPDHTVLEFHSAQGMALVQFGTAVLRRFLLRSYAVVAAGREDVGPALDRGLTSLFGGV
jgi:hypothetical protein